MDVQLAGDGRRCDRALQSPHADGLATPAAVTLCTIGFVADQFADQPGGVRVCPAGNANRNVYAEIRSPVFSDRNVGRDAARGQSISSPMTSSSAICMRPLDYPGRP